MRWIGSTGKTEAPRRTDLAEMGLVPPVLADGAPNALGGGGRRQIGDAEGARASLVAKQAACLNVLSGGRFPARHRGRVYRGPGAH